MVVKNAPYEPYISTFNLIKYQLTTQMHNMDSW